MAHPSSHGAERCYPARGFVVAGAPPQPDFARLRTLEQAVEDAVTAMRFGPGDESARLRFGLGILGSFPVRQALRRD